MSKTLLILGTPYTIGSLKHANKVAGLFFFSKGTMRFFDSRVSSKVFVGSNGWYFVTSERYSLRGHTDPRVYTVRRMDQYGQTYTASEFQQYETLTRALTAAKNMAREIRQVP